MLKWPFAMHSLSSLDQCSHREGFSSVQELFVSGKGRSKKGGQAHTQGAPDKQIQHQPIMNVLAASQHEGSGKPLQPSCSCSGKVCRARSERESQRPMQTFSGPPLPDSLVNSTVPGKAPSEAAHFTVKAGSKWGHSAASRLAAFHQQERIQLTELPHVTTNIHHPARGACKERP